jgi:hypothetical protein
MVGDNTNQREPVFHLNTQYSIPNTQYSNSLLAKFASYPKEG